VTVLAADWDAPPQVKVFSTTRAGGTSSFPFDSLNLAIHVGDDAGRVKTNRQLIRETQGWTAEPLWLNQIHGTKVAKVETLTADPAASAPSADGAVTSLAGQPLVVLTADCLPVAACDRAGTVIGVFHAGWRGLLAGILEEGLAALGRSPHEILVWIGPSIGQDNYQVGPEVYDAYLSADPAHEAEFISDGACHWKFDLAGAAVRRLHRAGAASVTQSRWDTFRDTDLFFSHRRHAPCGRIGTFICLQERSRL